MRTFCCCKKGKVLKSVFNDLCTFNSTKSDGEKSSIGVLIRSEDESSELYKEMKKCIDDKKQSFRISANDFFSSVHSYIGIQSDLLIKNLVKEKIIRADSDLSKCYIYGPEIEYSGKYICVDSNLKASEKAHVIGDASCAFRGLLPAMISGIYVALEMVSEKKRLINNMVNNLGIKISNSEPLDMIFTAQSKNYFYCRDVICQYVLNQGLLPINPFRVFDYFLGDRVERDIIRQGNNQLIDTCKELWVFGPIADGVLFEIALAKTKNKTIRFFSIGSTISDIHEIIDLSELTFEPEVHSKQIKKDELIAFVSSQDINDRQFRMEW